MAEAQDASTEEPIALGWYVAALAVFVVAGYYLKTWLLNWIIGPLFLLIVLYLLPTWFGRLRRFGRRQ